MFVLFSCLGRFTQSKAAEVSKIFLWFFCRPSRILFQRFSPNSFLDSIFKVVQEWVTGWWIKNSSHLSQTIVALSMYDQSSIWLKEWKTWTLKPPPNIEQTAVLNRNKNSTKHFAISKTLTVLIALILKILLIMSLVTAQLTQQE